MNYFNVKLGQILLDSGVISNENLSCALSAQQEQNKRLGEILIDSGVLSEQDLIRALEKQLHLPYLDVSEIKISERVAASIPETLARAYSILPVELEGGVLKIAVADPLNYNAIHDIEVYTGLNADIVICEKSKIQKKIHEVYTSQRVFDAAKSLAKTAAEPKKAEQEETKDDQPVISLINNMIEQAVIKKASDIHIDPQEDKMVVRFRIDGHLAVYLTTGIGIYPSVASRIKFIGGMNIAERRIPQDGRTTFKSAGQDIDLRISVLPSMYGEKIVIRITTALSFDMKKENIGFTPGNLTKFNSLIRRSYGIVLLTGPTGSGKSTTLYTAIREVKREDINIVTVENPVEMVIPGITQVNINPNTGLSFASALRSVLRQDPDIVMVGEIRDEETASIASSLAVTGHLVFSTLHTYDAPSAAIRLIDMGVAPYMVASTVIGVISQRLVRRICRHCRTPYQADEQEKKLLKVDENRELTLYRGKGCTHCNRTGFSGRTAIHEVMMVSDQIRQAILNKSSANEMKNIAVSEGMTTLKESARQAVLSGITTTDEIIEIYTS